MFAPLRKSGFLFCTVGAFWLGHCQTSTQPLLMPVCSECSLAAQTPTGQPLGRPQVEFLQAPEPYDWKGLSQQLGLQMDIHFELTARIVSARTLVLDVLDMSPIPKDEFSNLCGGLYVIALADARLKSILSQLNFNQLVKAKLFYGGNAEFPHEIVLSELALNARANSSMGGCHNRSGLLLSYRGNGDYVNVYNDGGIYYQDLTLNRFGTQKLSRDELAQLLKTFADSAFDTVPSSPPPMARYSTTTRSL